MDLSPLKSAMDQYVASGKIPGYNCIIHQNGKQLAYLEHGLSNVESRVPVTRDTIFRIYSMTKPLTCVAMMQLWEQGLFALNDPVHDYIPSWKNIGVFAGGSAESFRITSCERPMTISDLFTHTAGLSYGFSPDHPVDQIYQANGLGVSGSAGSLADKAELLSTLPLAFSPGTAWNYSVSIDVIGYLIEVLTGEPLDDYIHRHITTPLKMSDTTFQIAPGSIDRFASCYQLDPRSGSYILQDKPTDSSYADRPEFLSGGGGMLSTTDDYLRFCRMLLDEGTLDGQMILQPDTIRLMIRNHLPNNLDLAALSQSRFAETPYQHIGFGLGFSVVLDGPKAEMTAMTGEYGWGGMASTCFWIDPSSELIVIFMTQLIPSDALPIRRELRHHVYTGLGLA